MEITEVVKARIKEMMEKQDLTIYALADKAELSQPCISNWYTKKNYVPKIPALEKVCEALGITMAQLFLQENEELVPLDEESRRFLKLYENLDKTRRDLVMKLLEVMA